jgi:hyperosmotically inducible protein
VRTECNHLAQNESHVALSTITMKAMHLIQFQPEEAMKTLNRMGGALIALISINAWSQTSDPIAMPPQSSTAQSGHHSTKAARKANRALSRTVLIALSKGGVDTSGINVVAKSRAVVLEGSVVDASLIDKAGDLAKAVPGVTSVKNDLTLRDAGS